MNYSEAIDYIEKRQKFGIKLGLSRIKEILAQLENPHKNYKNIIVAGTNGKGSVVAMLSAVLTENGVNVGAYTSPHISDYTERIRIKDKDIDKQKFADSIKKVSDAVSRIDKKLGDPTAFEVITAAAFLIFSEQKIDLAVLEVGLGGRFDATNVVDPILSIITSVDLDHTSTLGGNIEKIAFEKAGIIKSGAQVLTSAGEKALSVIEDISNDVGAKMKLIDIGTAKLTTPLIGNHQKLNLGLVEETLKFLGINDLKSIQKGLNKTRWSGRFQIYSGNPLIILDGAHNPSAAKALTKTVEQVFGRKKINLIVGIGYEKDVGGIVSELISLTDFVVCTKSSHSMAVDPKIISDEFAKFKIKTIITDSIPEALQKNENKPVLITGSIFTVADALKQLNTSIDQI